MNNVSTRSEVAPEAKIHSIYLLKTGEGWSLLAVKEQIVELNLYPGDQVYIEDVRPKEGKVTITGAGNLERYSGQPNSFGVAHRLLLRDIH